MVEGMPSPDCAVGGYAGQGFGAGETLGSTGTYYSDLPGVQIGGKLNNNYIYLCSSGD